TEVGRVEAFIVKLGDGTYPPVKGLKVRVGAQDVFIGRDLIDSLEPGGVRLNTHTIRTEAFQRRPGEVLLAADVLGRHLVDVVKGRIVQAHDLVLSPGDTGWYLAGIDRSPQAMLRRLVPRRRRPELRKLLQYHPTTAGGMMSPDYVWVIRGATVDMALEAVRIDDKAPHALLGVVFITEDEGRFIGSISVPDLMRTNLDRLVEDLD